MTKTDGDFVETDSFPRKIDRKKYASFDYKEGEEYFRDIFENGEIVTSIKTGEAYIVPRKGKPIKIEGDLREFEKKIEAQGKENRFKRLLSQGKIEARIRTHAYNGRPGVLEIALAENTDWSNDYPITTFEAYAILADFEKRTGRIVKASYEGGPSGFVEKTNYKDAPETELPGDIMEGSKDVLTATKFRKINTEMMNFIRRKC